ncbi:aromatic ring-hydroxylating oxygenase subunit alpha [Rhodococcus koreensis]
MTLELERPAENLVTDGAYRKMTEDSVPSERYYSTAFAALEREKMWARAWQPACRIEEVPKIGDYAEYTVNDQSYLIVRLSETEFKAYYNHCRHRGNELGNGNGSYRSGKIVCSFHGWRWNLDGTNDKVLSPQGFTPACLDENRLRLREVLVDTAIGMVWINPDPNAAPLHEVMGETFAHWEPIKLADMRVRWWRYMKVEANWKTLMEPFMEAYHIAQTHPEITDHIGVDNWSSDIIAPYVTNGADGSGWNDYSGGGDNDPDSMKIAFSGGDAGLNMIDFSVVSDEALHDGIDAALMQDWQRDIQREVYNDKGLRDMEYVAEFSKQLYAEAERRGMPIPPMSEGGGNGFGFIFPNIVITSSYGNAFVMRTRPDGTDPERSIVEWYAVALPERDQKGKRPKRQGPLEYEDWGFVVQQDLSNIEKIQRGVRTDGFTDAFFSPKYEALVLHFHKTLEKYLDAD